MISLVVAMTKSQVIGLDGKLPWHLSEDLKLFKKNTIGKPIIMGRKTYDSIGKPLPGRKNIVLTKQSNLILPGCTVVHSVDLALKAANHAPEIMVIGGAAIYTLFLSMASRIYLSIVDKAVSGDTFFPKLDETHWKIIQKEIYTGFTFQILENMRLSSVKNIQPYEE